MILFLTFTLALGCGDKDEDTGHGAHDGGAADGGASDGGASDGGVGDGGSSDGGASDGGASDGGTSDGGASDGGASDGGAGDGGAGDGGAGDGGAGDGGASDGGAGDGGSDGYTFSTGPHVITIGALIEDTCVPGGSGEALPDGASTEVGVTVTGSDVVIRVSAGADLRLVGTVEAGALEVEQVTSTDFTSLGYDCTLEYRWWISGALVADEQVEGRLGVDYTPLRGAGCDDLAAVDGWVLPCGWAVEAALGPAR